MKKVFTFVLLLLMVASISSCNKSKIQELQSKVEESGSRVSELEIQVRELENQLEEIRSAASDLEGSISELRGHVDDFDSKDWRSNVGHVQDATSNVESAFDDLESKLN